MWAIGYVSRLPPAVTPNWLLFLLLLACVLAGGGLAARHSPRGWRAGLYAGLLTGLLNLIILGGLITGHEPGPIAPSAAVWVPGSVVFTAVLALLGGLIGGRFPAENRGDRNWQAAFSFVAAGTTLLLIITGGLVTGFEAGLAVPDWPNTYGSFMFMYPLAKMTGGIYYEHSHRLYGTLVGLSTLVLAIHTWRVDARRWVRRLALLALVLVIIQGVMGGLRVTGRPTLSQTPEDLSPSIALAVVHGVLGQSFFGLLIALGVFATRSWRTEPARDRTRSAGTDRKLSIALVVVLLIQLVLGALVRHIYKGVHIHVTMAVVVLILGLTAGARAWGFADNPRILKRLGRLLVIGFGIQLLLGFVALVVSGSLGGLVYPMRVQVPFTTAHQVVGALLLALAVALMVWSHRIGGSKGSGMREQGSGMRDEG
jgi:cytochrome c oxidase assembly protein subunit 15